MVPKHVTIGNISPRAFHVNFFSHEIHMKKMWISHKFHVLFTGTSHEICVKKYCRCRTVGTSSVIHFNPPGTYRGEGWGCWVGGWEIYLLLHVHLLLLYIHFSIKRLLSEYWGRTVVILTLTYRHVYIVHVRW